MINNQQQVEKQVLRESGALDVHSVFYTLQGEGPFAGTPAVFVRLAGCNLQCPGCDTNYTSHRQLWDYDKLVDDIGSNFPGRYVGGLVVITGGEPFCQNIAPFVHYLARLGVDIQIETNGTLWVRELPKWEEITIVCSPKTSQVNPELESRVTAWKYILQAEHVDSEDGLPLSSLETGLRPYRPSHLKSNHVFVQPMDEQDADKNLANTKAAVQSCLEYGYRLSLQQHKLLGVELP